MCRSFVDRPMPNLLHSNKSMAYAGLNLQDEHILGLLSFHTTCRSEKYAVV
jgi:HD superfamily phosphohydrolase YqeK